MFAVIKTGGKQYKVAAEDVLTIERLPGTAGDTITFDEVLLVHDGEATHVGSPRVSGACVAATLVEQARGDKVIAFKKRRRQNSRRKRGHRQDLTTVKIMEILTGGKRPAMASSTGAVTAHDNAGIAATAAAGLAAAKAAGIDTNKFQRLGAAIGDHDNLELIGGIGPTIAKKLNALGIWHFWQVVAMTQDDIDAVEHDVGFKGRATRDHWKDQAAELMAGKGPRAKSDQAALAAQHHD